MLFPATEGGGEGLLSKSVWMRKCEMLPGGRRCRCAMAASTTNSNFIGQLDE